MEPTHQNLRKLQPNVGVNEIFLVSLGSIVQRQPVTSSSLVSTDQRQGATYEALQIGEAGAGFLGCSCCKEYLTQP
ncbi:MAG: hypothetical protein GY922_01970 [Proteobacteria bacterium]|nr:hypothetical protein [Pseudomonadota bacterium]